MCIGNEMRNSAMFKELGGGNGNMIETLSKDEIGEGCSEII